MSVNNTKRSIFIWDVHWCYEELKLLIKQLHLTENDTVYFVWDLINKWPKSWKVLKLIYKNRLSFKAVLWNNEINFFRWLDSGLYDWETTWFKKLKEKFEENWEILDYIRNLPLYIEEKDFILLHWWIIPGKDLSDHSVDEITRMREYNGKPWYDYYTWEKRIIYGHWALNWLRLKNNTICLDTGCVYGKALTAYTLESWEIIQQQALDIYVNLYKKVC